MHKQLEDDNLLKSLNKFRGIYKYLFDNREGFAKNTFSSETTRYMVFPCDVVELRSIFSKRKVSFSTSVSLFSYFLAEKYLKNYPVFLVIDTKDLSSDKIVCGGIVLFMTDEIDIDRLIRIVVKGPFQVVSDLVKEFNLGVECLPSNSVPALNASRKIFPKISQNKSWYNKIAYNPASDDPEIEKGPDPAFSQYRTGVGVRDRRGEHGYPNKGLGFPQRFGKVIRTDDKSIMVEWEKNKVKPSEKEIFYFDDTIALYHVLERM